MDALQPYVARFKELEANHTASGLAQALVDYGDVPFYAAGLYLALVFLGQAYMKDRKPFNLKPLFILWNLLLATFSIYGAYMVVPYFLEHLQREGFYFTVCKNSTTWWNHGPVGFWTGLFALSKIPELVDTVFLVFQKKPVIFLHWYHHTTVMLYCWFAFIIYNTVGIYFCAMNYVVHSIMYSYYFLMSLSGFTRKLVRPFAVLITLLQIAQMVAGLVLVAQAQHFLDSPRGCEGVPRNVNRAALVMYASYFVLFGKFFLDAYVFKAKKGASKNAKLE